MENDRLPLRRLFDRMKAINADDDPEAFSDRVGMDRWEDDPATDLTEGISLADVRTGERVNMTSYPGAFDRPSAYPSDWPYLREQEAHFLSFESDDHIMRCMQWHELGDIEEAIRQVSQFMLAEGWHEHQMDHDSVDRNPAFRHIVWYHNGDAWRAFSEVRSPFRGLALMDVKPEQLWLDWPCPP